MAQLAKQQQSDIMMNLQDYKLDLSMLQSEFQWLQRQLDRQTTNDVVNYCRRVVFTHMDAQSLNLLKSLSDESLKLIDFEYAGYNARVADLANTFCEYCDMNNLQADYATQYPSSQEQDDFLWAYFGEIQDAPANLQLSAVKREIGKHTLISHLQWTVWSIVQNNSSDIEFDYLEYAKQRMEGYDYIKRLYFTRDEIDDD